MHEVKPSLPVTVRTNLPQSIFHAAPSYVYTGDDNRSWYPGGGKPPLPPSISESVITGPPKLLDENRSDYLIENAPTCPDNNLCLSINQVAPEPTGFPSIHKPEETDCC
ncbi:unnamed protein product [Heterobilharzia americana]|nr:unnamed protein product [Heterobilharzia americana]